MNSADDLDFYENLKKALKSSSPVSFIIFLSIIIRSVFAICSQVITEDIPWTGGLVGLNSFGLGGANGHTLLKSNIKSKGGQQDNDLPRLIIASGRTKEAVETILNCVCTSSLH